MEKKKKIIKIAFDLDGVIIDKPPLMPRWLIEWLFKGNSKNKLHYRFPKTRLEQFIRQLSHSSWLRPPIKKSLEIIKEMAANPRLKLYIISSRYSFLEQKTRQWLVRYLRLKDFTDVYLNIKNEQPHLFKEKILKKIKPDVFIDDDDLLIAYLSLKLKGLLIRFLSFQGTNQEKSQIIKSLKSL